MRIRLAERIDAAALCRSKGFRGLRAAADRCRRRQGGQIQGVCVGRCIPRRLLILFFLPLKLRFIWTTIFFIYLTVFSSVSFQMSPSPALGHVSLCVLCSHICRFLSNLATVFRFLLKSSNRLCDCNRGMGWRLRFQFAEWIDGADFCRLHGSLELCATAN